MNSLRTGETGNEDTEFKGGFLENGHFMEDWIPYDQVGLYDATGTWQPDRGGQYLENGDYVQSGQEQFEDMELNTKEDVQAAMAMANNQLH